MINYGNRINQLDTDVQFENLVPQRTDLVSTLLHELTRFKSVG